MIRLRNVTKHFGSVIALEDVSLEISSGEQVVIQGPSGSGKSTLLRLIAGLEIPTQGEISINENCVSTPESVASPHTRGIGFVFQRSALWPHMSVAQNILFAMNSLPKEKLSERLNQLLEQMELSQLVSRYPNQLSGGEARRVALARALACDPKILLLDEPLTSLNSELKAQILTVIQDFVQTNNTTLLYVTHLADETQHFCERSIYLHNGRAVEK